LERRDGLSHKFEKSNPKLRKAKSFPDLSPYHLSLFTSIARNLNPFREVISPRMNDVVFKTGGDWDSTTLFNNGQEVPANELFVDAQTGRNDFGDPDAGGVSLGGEFTAYIVTQDAPNDQMPIFPGRLVIRAPKHEIVVENTHPQFLFEVTKVWLDQQDVSNNLVDLHIEIDAVNNNVQGYITLYKSHFFSSDEVATITLL
jgi:hypothetical protein